MGVTLERTRESPGRADAGAVCWREPWATMIDDALAHAGLAPIEGPAPEADIVEIALRAHDGAGDRWEADLARIESDGVEAPHPRPERIEIVLRRGDGSERTVPARFGIVTAGPDCPFVEDATVLVPREARIEAAELGAKLNEAFRDAYTEHARTDATWHEDEHACEARIAAIEALAADDDGAERAILTLLAGRHLQGRWRGARAATVRIGGEGEVEVQLG